MVSQVNKLVRSHPVHQFSVISCVQVRQVSLSRHVTSNPQSWVIYSSSFNVSNRYAAAVKAVILSKKLIIMASRCDFCCCCFLFWGDAHPHHHHHLSNSREEMEKIVHVLVSRVREMPREVNSSFRRIPELKSENYCFFR